MLQEGKPFELLLDTDGVGLHDEPTQLRDFVRRCLSKKYSSFRETHEAAPIPSGSGRISDALAPIECEHRLIVFDIKTLLRKRNEIKSAILSPHSVADFLAKAAVQSAETHLDLLAHLQESFHATDPVFLFRADQLLPLLTLGASNPILLALPAIYAQKRCIISLDILFINHLSDHKTLNALLAAVAARQPLTAGTLDCTTEEPSYPAENPPKNATIHVHLGSSPRENASIRVVDSYAQGKLVVLVHDTYAQMPYNQSANSPMHVEHNVSGLRISRVRDVIPAVRHLLADAAMADLFRRNGDRIVSVFNNTIEERILGAL